MLELYKQGMLELAITFMEWKDGEKIETISPLDNFYWVGQGYDVFSDGSDYYHWSPEEMRVILENKIPYEIACEWQDLKIDMDNKFIQEIKNYRLEYYYDLRKSNITLSELGFYHHLEYLYYKDMMERSTKEYREKQKNDMEEIHKKLTKQFIDNIGK